MRQWRIRPGVWEGSHTGGRHKCLHLLKYPRFSVTIFGYITQKWLYFVGQESGLFWLVELLHLSENHYNLKALYIIN